MKAPNTDNSHKKFLKARNKRGWRASRESRIELRLVSVWFFSYREFF